MTNRGLGYYASIEPFTDGRWLYQLIFWLGYPKFLYCRSFINFKKLWFITMLAAKVFFLNILYQTNKCATCKNMFKIKNLLSSFIPSVSLLTPQSERLRLLKLSLSCSFRSKYSSIRLSLNSSCFLHTQLLHNAI